MRKRTPWGRTQNLLFAFFATALFMISCTEEVITPETLANNPIDDTVTHATSVQACSSCTYVVPANTYLVDGKALNLKPGSIIGLSSKVKYKNILFRNIIGTADKPIIIKNCDGTATLTATGQSFAIKTENSKYFKISGGTAARSYGIRIIGGHLGITLDKLSTNFEVDHIEISNSGFAGIMAKTDPTCDNATIRDNFTMKDVKIHDNYIHDTGGEGLYIGNSFFASGASTPCGKRLPHEIHNLSVYQNIVKNTSWDGIQIGSATVGAKVYNNTIENYGIAKRTSHNNGVQLGEGTGGLFYNNLIKSGTGTGLMLLGLGDNIVHNNIIDNAGGFGVFCDERYSTGKGFQFINNTIVNPKSDGIRIYADLLPMNVIMNNIIVNPGSHSTYKHPRTSDDAFIYKLSNNVKIQISNNYFTKDIKAVKFVNVAGSNYRLASNSPAVNKGKSINSYGITRDFYNSLRLKGSAYDIGASEY